MPLRRRALLGLLALGLSPARTVGAAIAAPVRDRWYADRLRRTHAVPPYRTQLDGSRYASSNCGPAVLGMALAAHGLEVETLELRRLTHIYQGTWPGRGGTALQHVARVAEDFGLACHRLYEAPRSEPFRRWSVKEIAEEVGRGRLVIPLVRYDMLPGHEGSGVRWGHYVLLYARERDGFRYHDPAFRPVEAGPARWIGHPQLDAAMNPVLVPRQAVALGG